MFYSWRHVVYMLGTFEDTDTAAGNQQKNPSLSLFFFFLQKSELIMLTQRTHKKDLKKRRPHLQGEKFSRVEG